MENKLIRRLFFVTIFLFLLSLVGCGSKNATSDTIEDEKQEESVTDEVGSMAEITDEIVSESGYVFQRNERSIEVQSVEQFDEYVKNQERMLVIFYATWCPYCADLDSRVPEILEGRDDLIVLNVDVDRFKELANAYQAITTPSVVYFQQGKQPYGFQGALPNEYIFEFLEKAEQREA